MSQKYKQESKKEVSEETRSVRQCSHPQRTRRQESAKKCQKARAKRTNQEQLNHLDKLLGENKGAEKERGRLRDRITKSKTLKKEEKDVRKQK